MPGNTVQFLDICGVALLLRIIKITVLPVEDSNVKKYYY
jgi:hypothetical protein